MSTFEWRGRHLHYETYGGGPDVVVLLHGLLLDTQLNRSLARGLAASGRQVILLDLLGHGRSEKSTRAADYRFDTYAEQVIALLDHLGLDAVTLGGISLGANVSLITAVAHPERVRALVLEMPVLEWAVPSAALTFVPLLLAAHYARRSAAVFSRLAGSVPRTGNGLVDSFLGAASLPPPVVKAILHGILVGPVAPTVEERASIGVPTLVIGHRADLIHPFGDAENLTEQMPAARLVPGRLPFGYRLTPRRLLRTITEFLDARSPATGSVGDLAPR